MGVLTFIFFLLIVPPILCSAAAKDCSVSYCGRNFQGVRFPFWFEGQQPEICGYPGFTLRCGKQGTILLTLPSTSGDFAVRSIDYRAQVVHIYDPSGCLPGRLLGQFNLSGSPFSPASYQNYTFLSCPTSFTQSRYTTIECLSNSTTSTLATTSTSFANLMDNQTSCKIITSMPIPVSRYPYDPEGMSSSLSGDIALTWGVPNCEDCETNGGTCGFADATMQGITCSYDTGTGNKGQAVFRIVALAIAIPAMTCSVAIAYFICLMDVRLTNRSRNSTQPNTPASVAPEATTITVGLDETTIESYTKVVLGESKRIPGPNHVICPICLSDYHAKETVRCIPECKHCFHAECIDEWLRRNGTCPVCRNSPAHRAHVDS